MFEENIDPKKINNHILDTIFYDSKIMQKNNSVYITIDNVTEVEDNED